VVSPIVRVPLLGGDLHIAELYPGALSLGKRIFLGIMHIGSIVGRGLLKIANVGQSNFTFVGRL
jgi:hypothetical protein